MTRNTEDLPTRSVLLSFKFLGTALVGSLTMGLVSTFAALPEQIATLGAFISILAGLFFAYIEQEDWREQRRGDLLALLRVPLSLAPEHELFDQYRSFSESIAELARRDDHVLRRFAELKLTALAAEMQSLARGIGLSLVRESEIAAEPDLLADFGIYGTRATGVHELDEQGRTLRFVLQFDLESLKLAADRWSRLALYASPYSDLLDRKPGGD